MSSGNHAHLNNLATIRFLVVDEADRMVSQGSFPQLESILDKIQRANPSLEYFREHLADESDDGSGDEEEDDRMMGLPGIRGEAKVQMLNDELWSMIAKQEKGGVTREGGEEEDDMSVDEGNGEEKEKEGTSGSDEDEEELDMRDSGGNDTEDDEIPEPMEMDDEEYALEQARMEAELVQMHEAEFGVGTESTEGAVDNNDSDSDEDDDEKEGDDDLEEDDQKPIKRQTFIFSATLTLPSSTHHNIESSMSGGKGGKAGLRSIDGAIADILEKVGAQGQTKVVDLSSALGSNTNSTTSAADAKKKKKKGKDSSNITDDVDSNINASTGPSVVLPPGLSLYEIKCTQMHKDSHLYAFLATTKQGSSGPCLVFCNSIGAVKRVAETLRTLGMPVRTLHAQMQQKARLSSLESLSKSNSRSIVVCTDVAARGLDIPSVASVVHYDVARAVDTFVHRAGRTARGMGEDAIGWSVSLVSASEDKSHITICRVVLGEGKKSLDVAPMDYRLLANASQRVNLATKIVSCNDAEARTSKNNQWFIDAAEEAGLDLDEDLLDDGLKGGDRRDQQRLVEAKNARKALKQLLAKPMRTQNHGKFLSTAGLQHSVKAETEVKPFVVTKDVNMDGKGAGAGGGGGKRMKKKRKIS
mmetsp:Transcript_15536/g.22633  ORF Transcript_15536/g.22633 Transcript_15536/m.22633 type:complete len:642 (+) Transcript_15536:2186-4111(+)